jgi:hypothetical protein
VGDQIGEEVAGPAHPALEHAEAQGGEALDHAAEDEGAGEGVAARGEVPDVIEAEVVGRLAPVPAHRSRAIAVGREHLGVHQVDGTGHAPANLPG